jgi:hypothetical protein
MSFPSLYSAAEVVSYLFIFYIKHKKTGWVLSLVMKLRVREIKDSKICNYIARNILFVRYSIVVAATEKKRGTEVHFRF